LSKTTSPPRRDLFKEFHAAQTAATGLIASIIANSH
jgi:hypothetical protein